jgi:hypothetical protein
MSTVRTTTRRIALLAVAAATALGIVTAPAAAMQTEPGALQAFAGGYRDVTDAGSFALPLPGLTFQHDGSALFDMAPTTFGPTDANGAATDPMAPGGTRYVREATAPTGWTPLTTLGSYGSAQPYIGSAMVDGDSVGSPAVAHVGRMSTFVAAAANPPLPTTCGTGLKALLLLDTSGSTSGYIDEYKTAAKTFVSTLAGTPTTLRISSFSTISYPGATTYDLATTAGQTAANAEIDRVYGPDYAGELTNWDAAFQDAAKAGVDVIVFVTDGVPTVHLVGGTPTSGSGGFEDVAYGIAAANLAKYPQLDQTLTKQRVLGVGVGSGIAVENLAAVSGPTEGSDYTVAASPDALAAVLKGVATKICPPAPTPVTPVTPVVAAAAPSAILPPATVRGTSRIAGVTGCTYRGSVVTRVWVRNAAHVTFVRDGRVVRQVAVPTLGRRMLTLRTVLAPGDFGMHTVTVRVRFAAGAVPAARTMHQRFAQCRASTVTG